MRSLLSVRPLRGLFCACVLALCALPAHATTYFVRTDGGTASQCTGLANQPYPGSGTTQPCAWNSPLVALPPSGALRISGGDTLLIGPGTYQVGASGYMQPIPSGTVGARTRILGNPSAKLVGVGGTHRVVNLNGSSHVELGQLEVTDNSDCVYQHYDVAAVQCAAGMPWARVGVYGLASDDVWLHDLDIHGIAARGINAGQLSNWTLERVKITKNGLSGWDGNVGTGNNSGSMVLRNVEVAWNGCGEKIATGEPWACWAQFRGGYGDGVGMNTTGGQWLIEDSFFHHNTSDGLDLRYLDGADTTHVIVRRTYAVANAGNQVKLRGNATVENSVMVGYCSYFKNAPYMGATDQCRASGSTLMLVFTGNDHVLVRHNTLAGEGDVQIGHAVESTIGNDELIVQSNVAVGFPQFLKPAEQSAFAGSDETDTKLFTTNMGWNLGPCPVGVACTQNPLLTDMNLASFDAEPLPTSPVLDQVALPTGMEGDFLSAPRPSGLATDIGAYEYQVMFGGVCIRAKPTLTLVGTGNPTAPGTSQVFSVALRNNNTSECGTTTFSLARTVPAGWSGAFSVGNAIAVAPNTEAVFSLTVVSSATASNGSYPVSVGISSPMGAVHTASATAYYEVRSLSAKRAKR